MANYRPKKNFITAASVNAASGAMLSKSISTSTWGLFLLHGVAFYDGTVLKSGALALWKTVSAQATGSADANTFTDANGLYGISLKTGTPYTARFYTYN